MGKDHAEKCKGVIIPDRDIAWRLKKKNFRYACAGRGEGTYGGILQL